MQGCAARWWRFKSAQPRWTERQREGEGVVDPIFAMLDANGDGVISVEEMREFMRELGTPLPVTQGPGMREANGGVSLLGAGAGRSASLTRSSSASVIATGSGANEKGGQGEEWEAARQLVALMDANTDGTVCAKEFAEFRRQVSEQCIARKLSRVMYM